MPNLISLATTQTVELNQIGLIILGGLAFAVAIRWLISSAKIIDVTSKIATSLSKHKKNKTLDDDTLTGFIVKMAAAYRENKPTLKLMMNISKIAGVLFVVAAFTCPIHRICRCRFGCAPLGYSGAGRRCGS